MPHKTLLCAVFAAAFAGTGLHGCTSPPLAVEELAGRYELRSVNDRAVPEDGLGARLAGELVLSAGGQARRTAQHATSGIPGPIVIRETGTYRVLGAEITLTLRAESSKRGTAARPVRGMVSGPTITLWYPGRADAPVQELYVRVP